MKILANPSSTAGERRGAAMMISLLILLVLILIIGQISIGTATDKKVTINSVRSTGMEMAMESALLRVYDQLVQDAEADAEAGAGMPGMGGGAGGPQMSAGIGGLTGDAGGGDASGPVDSKQDEWARPERTSEINDVQLRILIQDEESKYNVLTMLTPNEDEATKAFDRVVRILDFCREGTLADFDEGEAESMAEAMLEFMRRRSDALLARPSLLTDDEEEQDIGLPLTLEDFRVLEPFRALELDPDRPKPPFKDYYDEDDNRVHSITSFLTVWSSIDTYENYLQAKQDAAAEELAALQEEEAADDEDDGEDGGGQQGGIQGGTDFNSISQSDSGDGLSMFGAEGGSIAGAAVNVNTAPRAVLEALFDERDCPREYWSDVVWYRNQEEEEEGEDDEDDVPILDEFGEEIIERQIFDSVSELGEVDGWDNLEPIVQAEIEGLARVDSNVFSIYLTARRKTGSGGGEFGWDAESIEEEERSGEGMMINVRCVVWRRSAGQEQGWQIVPLERWERIDYQPLEVRDYGDDEY